MKPIMKKRASLRLLMALSLAGSLAMGCLPEPKGEAEAAQIVAVCDTVVTVIRLFA